MAYTDSRISKIVAHYLRNNYEKISNIQVPSDLRSLIQTFATYYFTSNIISLGEQYDFIYFLRNTINDIEEKELKLLYRASEHNFSSNLFHSLCDEYSPTLVIVKSNWNNIFGGYTTKTWNSELGREYKSDKDAFLYLWKSNDPRNCSKIYHNNPRYRGRNAILCTGSSQKKGPVFGSGHDLQICDRSNKVKRFTIDTDTDEICYTYNNLSYNHGNVLCGGKRRIAGVMMFTTIEYEVFHIR